MWARGWKNEAILLTSSPGPWRPVAGLGWGGGRGQVEAELNPRCPQPEGAFCAGGGQFRNPAVGFCFQMTCLMITFCNQRSMSSEKARVPNLQTPRRSSLAPEESKQDTHPRQGWLPQANNGPGLRSQVRFPSKNFNRQTTDLDRIISLVP